MLHEQFVIRNLTSSLCVFYHATAFVLLAYIGFENNAYFPGVPRTDPSLVATAADCERTACCVAYHQPSVAPHQSQWPPLWPDPPAWPVDLWARRIWLQCRVPYPRADADYVTGVSEWPGAIVVRRRRVVRRPSGDWASDRWPVNGLVLIPASYS